MSRISAFVRLDFITVKAYFKPFILLLYGVMVAFMTYTSGGGSGLGIGLIVGMLYLSYPFAVGEKSNMDALYMTLSLARETVVAGRYLFVLVLNAINCIAVLIIALAVIFIKEGAVSSILIQEIISTAAVMLVLIIVIEALQLPIYFKFGYTKARFASLIPLCILMGGYAMLAIAMDGRGNDVNAIMNIAVLGNSNTAVATAFIVLGIALIVYVSYRLSVSFYKKRDF